MNEGARGFSRAFGSPERLALLQPSEGARGFQPSGGQTRRQRSARFSRDFRACLRGMFRAWEGDRSEMGSQKGAQRAEGFAPMADGGLRIAHFRERFSIRRVEEDRVVAEPAVALR